MSIPEAKIQRCGIDPGAPSGALGSALPIAHALAVASAAGIATIEITRGTLSAGFPGLDRAEIVTWLETLIGADAVWARLAAEPQPSVTALAAVALVHLHDGVLPDTNLIVPIMPSSSAAATTALRDSLIEPCLERLGILRDIQPGATLEIVIRPGPSAWLQLGATVHFAKLRTDGLSRVSAVRTAASGGLETAHCSTGDGLVQRLARLWPCNFDATLVEFENALRLVDVSIGERSEEENTRRLAQLISASDGPSTRWNMLLANAAVRVPSAHRAIRAPLCRGQSQGARCASGPLATTLMEAARFVANGQRPILVVPRLLPAEASGLEGCGGLVVGRDGPASHIAILARSLGLAVVTRVEGLQAGNDASVSLGAAVLRAGDLISIHEEDGGIYQGVILAAASPITSIATWLEQRGDNPVAVATNANSTNLPTRRVGLCRSEMQILGSSVAPVFKAYLARAVISKRPEPVPEELKAHLRNCLAELLATSRGELVNYRLIDADLGEVLDDRPDSRAEQIAEKETLPDVHATVRGPRWALACGFYDWQLGMAIATAAAVTSGGPVNLIITLPSAFSLEEVRAVRVMFDRHLLEHPGAQSSVRFGVMLETPRLCAAPSTLAVLADVFSFGLNDLTSASYGLAREAWAALGPYYAAAGLEAQDPFSSLDVIGVGPLVARTIRELRYIGAKGPVLLCGEPAASAVAHNHFAVERNLYFSVGESDWARATLSCARVKARRNGSVGFEHSPAHEQTAATLRQVIAARAIGRDSLAQEAALLWSASICPLQPSPGSRNWKVLKKLLVAGLFGALEGRFFSAPWGMEEVARYVRSLDYPGRATRVSAFQNEISCHARSEIISSDWSETELLAFLSSFDPDTTLNIFPQQHPDQMCFRLVVGETGLVLEAGWGQAMYVFEAERGQHPIMSCQAETADGLAISGNSAPERLSSAFHVFLENQRRWMQVMHDVLPTLVGARHVAIEGYFNPATGKRVIVDMDLPLDLAWNTKSRPTS